MLPRLKDDGLPPKAYYRLGEAAEILGCTPDSLIHYGATGRLELVTPLPVGRLVWATNKITSEIDQGIWPDFLVVPSVSCQKIESYGTAHITSFPSGYELWVDTPERAPPCFASLDENGNDIKPEESPHWEYLLYLGTEAMGANVDSAALFVIANELHRFKAGKAKKQVEIDTKKHGREAIDSINKPAKLTVLNRAFLKFWALADRNDRGTHSDNSVVAAWLEDRDFSSSLAKKAASIIRPDWAPTGRKPEE